MAPAMKKLSVIIPVYNEERYIEPVMSNIVAALQSDEFAAEFIVVDDHSTDKTAEILKAIQPKLGFRLVCQPRNQGKGAAVIRGTKEVSGDYVVIQDADFEYDPRDIHALVRPLIADQADVVYGSRFKKNSPQVRRTYHYFVNRLLTLLSNLFSGIYLTDMETCYKVFRADLFKALNLRSARFGIEVELTAYIAKTTARLYEFPVHYYPRTRLQGKKINWRDGVAALFHLMRFNLLVNFDSAFVNIPARYDPNRPGFSRSYRQVTDGE